MAAKAYDVIATRPPFPNELDQTSRRLAMPIYPVSELSKQGARPLAPIDTISFRGHTIAPFRYNFETKENTLTNTV